MRMKDRSQAEVKRTHYTLPFVQEQIHQSTSLTEWWLPELEEDGDLKASLDYTLRNSQRWNERGI